MTRRDSPTRHPAAPPSSVLGPLGRLGPLAPVAVVALLLLAVFGLSRLGLYLLYHGRLSDVGDAMRIFTLGLRIDLSLVCYLVGLPALLALLLPVLRSAGPAWVVPACAGTIVVALAVLLELITPGFLAEYDERPNRMVIELYAGAGEITSTLWASHKLGLLVVTPALALAAWLVWRILRAAILAARPWGIPSRLAALPLVAALVFLGARGTLGHRPINTSTAAFSSNHLANQLALNSTYSLAYSLYGLRHEDAADRIYGNLPRDELLERISRASGIPVGRGKIPFLHRTSPRSAHEPYNLVILLEESLGAEFVGCLGGLPLTPNLDRLADEGLLLTRLYSTGTRTVRGIEAVVSGFLPTPGRSVVKLTGAQRGFFTVADLLRRHGYTTEFIYGGESNFDDMKSFFLGNGFDRVHDEPEFANAEFRGVWGVSDEDLVSEANRLFAAHGDAPFFALLLTTSNHDPFDFPEGRIELYEEPAATRLNAMKYADHAIGKFFDLARRETYFERTVFLVVADHNTRTYGNDLVPIDKFHIPGLILGPGVGPGRIDTLASQIDLMPTILPLLGLELEHPMIGRDLLALPPGDPGRAILQFHASHAYMEGERVVVHLPRSAPRFFRYESGTLIDATPDPDLARTALAHAILPSWLYRNQAYRLP